jgi:hypothetical protein
MVISLEIVFSKFVFGQGFAHSSHNPSNKIVFWVVGCSLCRLRLVKRLVAQQIDTNITPVITCRSIKWFALLRIIMNLYVAVQLDLNTRIYYATETDQGTRTTSSNARVQRWRRRPWHPRMGYASVTTPHAKTSNISRQGRVSLIQPFYEGNAGCSIPVGAMF